MNAVCPKCGGPSNEGLCDLCALESTELLSCPERIEITVCSVCGAKLIKGKWVPSQASAGELAYDAACSAICAHEGLSKPNLDVKLIKTGATRYMAMADLKGTFRSMPAEAGCQFEVRILSMACDRCSRRAGRYFESTIQIRASSREPTEREMEVSKKMALEMAEAGYKHGDQLSFVQDIKETQGGLDIVLGSTQLGRQISKVISERFGGRITETSKLVGQRDGRDLCRSTLLVRLPRFKLGDIIRFRGAVHEVAGFEGKRIYLTTLKGGHKTVITDDEVEDARILGNRNKARKATVVAGDERILEIMDPDTYKVVLASRPHGLEVQPGQEVQIVRAGDEYIVLE